jgi:hypothetical protein
MQECELDLAKSHTHSESVESSSLSWTVAAEVPRVPGPVLDPASSTPPVSHSVIAAALTTFRSFRFLADKIGGVGSWAFLTLRISIISSARYRLAAGEW